MERYPSTLLDHMFKDIKETLDRIEAQTTKTNGRVTKLEKYILIVAIVMGTLAIIYFPQVLEAIKLFI